MSRKKKTLAKLGWACKQIEDILSGQNITIADVLFPHEKKPGETKLERLQTFKQLLNDTLAQLNRGEARPCSSCQTPLADEILDEMPWAFTCRSCVGS